MQTDPKDTKATVDKLAKMLSAKMVAGVCASTFPQIKKPKLTPVPYAVGTLVIPGAFKTNTPGLYTVALKNSYAFVFVPNPLVEDVSKLCEFYVIAPLVVAGEYELEVKMVGCGSDEATAHLPMIFAVR